MEVASGRADGHLGCQAGPPDSTLRDLWLARVEERVGGQRRAITSLIDELLSFARSPPSEFVSDADSTAAQPRSRPGAIRKCRRGVLVVGKPGTGKTSLVKAVLETSGLPYEFVHSPDIFQTDAGSTESELQAIFDRSHCHARRNRDAASVVVLDEIDVIAGKRKRGTSARNLASTEVRVFSLLLSALDCLEDNVFVIGISHREHAISPTVTRSGRLDKRYELTVASARQRTAILEILSRKLPFANSQRRKDILESVGKATHGFVASDLERLCTVVGMALVNESTRSEVPSPGKTFPQIELHHFVEALTICQPAILGELQSKRSSRTFADLYGIDDAIEELKTSVMHPFQHPDDFVRLGIMPPRGILVYGPSGVGKTALCTALANEAGVNFVHVEGSQLRSKIVGESEQRIARIFAQAKASAPCILFLDQLDVLAPRRGTASTSEGTSDRIITSLLTEMDGFLTCRQKGMEDDDQREAVQVDLLVVAVTNRPEVVDPALLRPGRLDVRVFVPLPNLESRRAIFRGVLSQMPVELSPVELENFCLSTEGYSGADIENVCREAALISLRENINNQTVVSRHFECAMSLLGPRTHGC